MAVNLTPGAISKIVTGKCTENDLKPVLQVTYIRSVLTCFKDGKQRYGIVLSDGSVCVDGFITDKVNEMIRLKQLQKGSVVQLTMFSVSSITHTFDSFMYVYDLHVIRSKCDIIGDPKPLPYNETPLMEKSVPPISDQEHADSDLNEDVDDTHHGEEPPALKQNPSDSTQNCSSHSLSQSKKRKCQSSNDKISAVLEDISKVVRTMMEKNKEDGVDACYKKLEKLEEDVSKMTKLMMEKSKEVDAGFKKFETLEEDVSKMMKLIMEKNKEDDAGYCFKKLETFEDVSKMTRMMMEKNKEDVVGFKKLETLEEEVSKMTKLMMEKNKKDVVGFKKLEKLEEDVSKMAKMMTDKNKEDDMGACIEKLDKMGWGAEEPIYDTALLLFLKGADYRKLWLHLKPECCGKWVKIAGSIFGLLD